LGFLLYEVVSHGGDSPWSTPSPEDYDPEVESGELDLETCGLVTCDPDICGLVTCGPVIIETGGPELCVTEVCCGLT
jgi:hypothetical protein